MVLAIFLIIIGFALLIVGADLLVDGSSNVAKRFHIPEIIIGLTIVSIGTSMLMTDGLIVLAGGFFFGWTRVLYALIVLYIINIMVDKVVLGISGSKAIYITTDADDEVCNYLLNELKLGITLLETRGGYTNKKDQIIMCVVPTIDYFKVSEGIEQIDPKAVVLVTDAYQTSGTYRGNTRTNR